MPINPKSDPKSDPKPPWRVAPVPQGRTSRLLHFGRAVGELAAGAAAHAVSQLARGRAVPLAQALLTPGNARRLATRLSAMRGAVMKVGQLMSMDGKGVLPPAFAELLGELRDRAHTMPTPQLMAVLEREYGPRWAERFQDFGQQPIASASIGQVHKAVARDGRVLALKIQHPGVADSIDSDMDNLALLLRMPGLVPQWLDPAPLLQRVRVQLHRETDYVAEAKSLSAYRLALGDDPVLSVPAVHPDLSTPHILATDFAQGEPLDRLMQGGRPQDERDAVATALCRLAVREVYVMRWVQTDPNFGNYLYDAQSGRIALLDFGATERVSLIRVKHLRNLTRAMRDDDLDALLQAALTAGLMTLDDPPEQRRATLEMMLLAGEPLRCVGPYDFSASDLSGRVFKSGREQARVEGFSSAPPPDMLFLQRKFIGTFLQCSRLQARVDLGAVFEGHL